MQPPIVIDPILLEIISFCERNGMAQSTFGKNAVNDRALVLNLRNGREVRRMTRYRISRFMRDFKPPKG